MNPRHDTMLGAFMDEISKISMVASPASVVSGIRGRAPVNPLGKVVRATGPGKVNSATPVIASVTNAVTSAPPVVRT